MTEMEHQMRMIIASMNTGQVVITDVPMKRIHTEPNAHIATRFLISQSPIVIGLADLVTSDFTIAIKQVPVIMVG
jgi:hypothetical protein